MGKYVADKGHKNVLVVSVNEKDIAVGVKRRSGILDALENSNVENVDVLRVISHIIKLMIVLKNILKIV